METNSLSQLVASASDKFQQRYGRPARWIVAAPGRVNIIGEHVDYNDGFVLPMAIDRYCVLAAGPNDEAQMTIDESQHASSMLATIFSTSTNEEIAISLDSPQRHSKPGHWSNYFAGVIAACNQGGVKSPPFVAVAESSVPVGGGLSSSAAIEVATATLVEAMTGAKFDLAEKALLCQWAEHKFAGVPCGIMDQFASALSRADHLMLLDCRSQQVEHVPFTDPNVTVLIINTNVKHELSGGEYAERRGQCESAAKKLGVKALRDVTPAELEANKTKLTEIECRRARHIVNEIARMREAPAALKASDWPKFGRLMYDSHTTLRDDYEVSCPELDLLVDLAHKIGPAGGVIGSRMTGGGFGGCTVSLIETTKVAAVAESIAESYRAQTGIEPTILTSRPAQGAHIIKAE